jgi:phosphoribosylformylglycinamidine synthase
VVKHKGEVVADMPITALSDAAPIYERPYESQKPASGNPPYDKAKPVLKSLKKILGSADMASRRWVWEQYDHTVMADTVQVPGGDAAVVRVHGTQKALAITTDVTPRYCQADPYEGAKQAVAEAWRNITAVGAIPLAVTDNLNYGNPQKPEIMWQIVAGVDGIGDACRALDFPVIGGNCSLYNETNGEAILPTPAIGGVGLMRDVTKMATIALKRDDDALLLIGETKGHLGQSVYLREIEGKEDGAAPVVQLATERKNGDFVRKLIEAGRVDTVHDCSDGGVLVALAEMAMAGNLGIETGMTGETKDAIPFFFGEDQSRYILAVPRAEFEKIKAELEKAGIVFALLGHATAAKTVKVTGHGEVALSDLRRVHEGWFPRYMSGEEIPVTN